MGTFLGLLVMLPVFWVVGRLALDSTMGEYTDPISAIVAGGFICMALLLVVLFMAAVVA